MSSVSITSNSLAGDVARRARVSGAGTKLNLVSLMDIFTILVFFLMLNTGEVEVLQPDEKIALPQSFAQLRPDTSPVIKVSTETIYFKEQAIVSLDELRRAGDVIEPLYARLVEYQKSRPANAEASKGAIAIMGDAGVNYALLKKVLNTCAQAGFRDVSLAVEYASRNSVARVATSADSAGVGS